MLDESKPNRTNSDINYIEVELRPFTKDSKRILKLLMIEYFKEIDLQYVTESEQVEILNYPFLDLYWTEQGLA